jgi:hypothetical protein
MAAPQIGVNVGSKRRCQIVDPSMLVNAIEELASLVLRVIHALLQTNQKTIIESKQTTIALVAISVILKSGVTPMPGARKCAMMTQNVLVMSGQVKNRVNHGVISKTK